MLHLSQSDEETNSFTSWKAWKWVNSGLRVSKLSLNYHFWWNCSCKHEQMDWTLAVQCIFIPAQILDPRRLRCYCWWGFRFPGQTQNSHRSTNGHKNIPVSDFAKWLAKNVFLWGLNIWKRCFIVYLSLQFMHPLMVAACIFCWNASVLHTSWRHSISKAQLPISAGHLPFDYMWSALCAMQSISRVVEERTQSESCFVWRTL